MKVSKLWRGPVASLGQQCLVDTATEQAETAYEGNPDNIKIGTF
jgi:hypothetical protein